MRSVSIIHNFPRSGGTVFSRCIGAMQGVVLLSEINPHPGAQRLKGFSIITQAVKWHRLAVDKALREDMPFAEKVALILDACEAAGKTLVLRDWAHVDYFGPPVTREAALELSLNRALEADFELRCLALVRHPIDNWLSMRKLGAIRKLQIDVDEYLRRYRLYVESFRPAPVCRYERFARRPEQALQRVASHLGFEFDPGFRDRWQRYRRVTGDTHGNTRAGSSSELVALGRPVISEKLERSFLYNRDYYWLLENLGYDHLQA